MQTGNTDFIYRNELEKACFKNDMAYGRQTQADKVLKDKAFKIASDPKCDGSMVYKFFDKKSGSCVDATRCT